MCRLVLVAFDLAVLVWGAKHVGCSWLALGLGIGKEMDMVVHLELVEKTPKSAGDGSFESVLLFVDVAELGFVEQNDGMAVLGASYAVEKPDLGYTGEQVGN